MKIIISHRGIKREIRGAFEITSSADDFSVLRDLIDNFLWRGSAYGSIDVPAEIPRVLDEPPRKWDD